eukprot:CAMPEP_0118950190 /NCGR_PEP_ID=MMETSP1169-20130426/50936_1 /TAXON_ID=36882 /ORGANISM="Pyramimonas obovata, Strain CCMP722" /LENGTH=56 /DNA_ID=CAMNT_0006896975 /DNA_START=199 /DNA_END=369 /DNA_ORIENTATION=-
MKRPRLAVGRNSAKCEKTMGTDPPTPIPASIRKITNERNEGAAADATAKAPLIPNV